MVLSIQKKKSRHSLNNIEQDKSKYSRKIKSKDSKISPIIKRDNMRNEKSERSQHNQIGNKIPPKSNLKKTMSSSRQTKRKRDVFVQPLRRSKRIADATLMKL